jgi:hypothetical protein
MARKRAPGGGRKPQGDFAKKTAVLTTRITQKTRSSLERAAHEGKLSISQEAERRIDQTFIEERRHRIDVRALATTIMLVAEWVERSTGEQWRNSAFVNAALRDAIELVIRHFGPGGNVTVPAIVTETAARMPPEAAERYVTPSGVGHTEAWRVITMIESWDYRDIGMYRGPDVPPEWDLHWRLFRDLRTTDKHS